MIGAALVALAVTSAPLVAPGPQGALAGTLVEAQSGAPVVLVVPGSGPTDRDGNNPLGVTAAPYRRLAEALAERGVASVRIDKRGMFGSRAAVADANRVTIADYVADVRAWREAIRERTGADCTWLLGHSEGALVALVAAQRPEGLCGVILVAGPGRKLSEVMRGQLRANPANAPILDSALATLDALEAGRTVDVAGLHPALQQLFAPAVQPFLIDVFRHDPAKLGSTLAVPALIVQGERDIQVPASDARALAAAQPQAKLVLLPRMNHVLSAVDGDDRRANLAAYADPSRPVEPALVEAIADYVRRPR